MTTAKGEDTRNDREAGDGNDEKNGNFGASAVFHFGGASNTPTVPFAVQTDGSVMNIPTNPTTTTTTTATANSSGSKNRRHGRTTTTRHYHSQRRHHQKPSQAALFQPPSFRQEVMQWLDADSSTAAAAMLCALQSAICPEPKKENSDDDEGQDDEKEEENQESTEGTTNATTEAGGGGVAEGSNEEKEAETNDQSTEQAAAAAPPPLGASFSWQAKMIWTFLYGRHATVPPRSPRDLARCQEGSLQRTPLHIAAYHGADEAAIRMLLDVYPQAACLLDRRGHSPLQLVFYGTAAAAAIPANTSAGGADVAQEEDSSFPSSPPPPPGSLIRRSVVEALLRAHHGAAKEETARNEALASAKALAPKKRNVGIQQSLLHLAATHSGSCEEGVLELIFRANPSAAFFEDSMGRTPLQIFLSSPSLCPSQAVTFIKETLFAQEEQAHDFRRRLAATRDARGQTALHRAVDNGMPIELIQLLVKWSPGVSLQEDVATEDANHYTPLHLAFLGDAAMQSGSVIRTDVVKTLLDAHPELASLSTKQQEQTPLHLTVARLPQCQDFSLLETVFVAHPKAALQRDSLGRMPLHVLMATIPHTLSSERQASLLPVVRSTFLATAKNGEGVDARDVAAGLDSNGATPLHLAVYHGAGVEWIQLLLEVYPEAAMRRDSREDLPVSLVLKKEGLVGGANDVQVLTALLQANPKAAQEPNNSKQLLLHLAATYSHECDVEIMELLLQANPFALLSRGSQGRTPLHILIAGAATTSPSCARPKSRKTLFRPKIRGTVSTNKSSTSKGQEDGSSEGVADDGASKERLLHQTKILLEETKAVVTLVKQRDDKETNKEEHENQEASEEGRPRCIMTSAAAVMDQEGFTPLHLATLSGCPTEIFEMLLAAYPAAAGTRDRRGRLPLHLAVSVSKNQSVDRIKLLLSANPQAAFETDGQCRTPLFNFLIKPFDCTALFDLIFEANTEAAKMPDGNGVTPLMKVLQWRSRSDVNERIHHVVQAIVDKCPEAVAAGGDGGGSNGCVVVQENNSNAPPLHRAVMDRRDPETTRLLLEQHPEAAEKRHGNSTPLSVAVSQGDEFASELLLSKRPQAAQTLLANESCALHEVGSLKILVAVFDAWPEGILQKETSQGRTPLHKWMRYPGFSTTMKSQILQHIMLGKHGKEAMQVTDNRGLTPLHHALGAYSRRNRLTKANVCGACVDPHFRELMRVYPDALFLLVSDTADSDEDASLVKLFRGTSIVGLVCRFPETEALTCLATLFEALWPHARETSKMEKNEAVGSKTKSSLECSAHDDDEEGGDASIAWALHKICEHSHQSEVVKAIQVLHCRCPRAVRSSRQNRLALHVACARSDCSLKVVEQLTEMYGAALTMQDGRGQVPLTVACRNDAPLNVLYHLLRSSPDNLLGMSPP